MKKWVVGWRSKNGMYTHHFYAFAESEDDAVKVMGSYKWLSRLQIRYVFEADETTRVDETFLELKSHQINNQI